MSRSAEEHKETALWQYRVDVLLIRGLSGVHQQVRCACLTGRKRWKDGGVDRIECRLDGGGVVGGDPRGRSVAPAWLEVLGFGYYILGQEKNSEQRVKRQSKREHSRLSS